MDNIVLKNAIARSGRNRYRASRALLLNQMAGPLFRELAEDVSKMFADQSELYTGHADTLKRENVIAKLQITKSPSYNRKNKVTRLWSWLAYSFFAFFKMIFSPKETLIILTSNPPLLGPFVWIIRQVRGLEYVVLIYDLHPDALINFSELSEQSWLVRVWRYVNTAVWERALAVYTIGEVMAKRLSEQFDVSKTRLNYVGVIPPWADTDRIKPVRRAFNPLANEFGVADSFTVLYSGNMGISHDIESMLKAAEILKHRSDIKFLFVGEGEQWQTARNFVKENDLTNTSVVPFQPEARLPYVLALADISLVALDKGAEGLMVPSKTYYYMAAGSAIIGICQGENDLEASLVLGNCGFVVRPGECEALAEKILHLVDHPENLTDLKNNARNSSIAYYSRAVCVGNFKRSLQDIFLGKIG